MKGAPSKLYRHVGENAANLGGRTIRSQFPEETISFVLPPRLAAFP